MISAEFIFLWGFSPIATEIFLQFLFIAYFKVRNFHAKNFSGHFNVAVFFEIFFEFRGILISRFSLNTTFHRILNARFDQNTLIYNVLVSR